MDGITYELTLVVFAMENDLLIPSLWCPATRAHWQEEHACLIHVDDKFLWNVELVDEESQPQQEDVADVFQFRLFMGMLD